MTSSAERKSQVATVLEHKINAFGFDTFGAVVERKN
jgi:hypothetical protein